MALALGLETSEMQVRGLYGFLRHRVAFNGVQFFKADFDWALAVTNCGLTELVFSSALGPYFPRHGVRGLSQRWITSTQVSAWTLARGLRPLLRYRRNFHLNLNTEFVAFTALAWIDAGPLGPWHGGGALCRAYWFHAAFRMGHGTKGWPSPQYRRG